MNELRSSFFGDLFYLGGCMNIHYECQYFKIYELVDPVIYANRGEKAWELFDPTLLDTLDVMRDYFYYKYNVVMIVNNWMWGGSRKWSGFRTPESSYYSPTSQHSHGRAVDFLLMDRKTKKYIDTQKIRDDIIENQNSFEFDDITCIEDFPGMNWVHIDTRNFDKANYGLKIVGK